MIRGHEKAVLQFSGGKDSLACLYLLEPHWSELTVMWCNTQDSLPETINLMREVAGKVHNFVIVQSDQPKQNEQYGPPTDLLSVWDTELGRSVDQSRTHKFQSPFQCCGMNLWEPLQEAVDVGGYTLIIRGQRNSETHKSTIRSGHMEAGREYWFPIEAWSEAEVRTFLDTKQVPLPAHYKWFNSSLDCASCTAYLAENKGKLAWMQHAHPEQAQRLVRKLHFVHSAAMREIGHLREVIGEYHAA